MTQRVHGAELPGDTWRPVATGILIGSTLFIKSGPAGMAYSDGLLVLLAAMVAISHLQVPLPGALRKVMGRLVAAFFLWAAALILSSLLNGMPDASVLQVAKHLVGPAYALLVVILLAPLEQSRVVKIVIPATVASLGVLVAASLLGQAGLRTGGTFGNPIHSATWAASALCCLLLIGRRRRIVAVLATLLASISLALSASFAVYLAVLVAVVYYVTRRPGISLLWPFVIAPAAVLFWAFGDTPRLLSFLDPTMRAGASAQSREAIWSTALHVAEAAPAFGIGPGQFSAQVFVPIPGAAVGFETHNDYLAALAETGVVGLAMLLLLFATLWSCGGRTTRVLLVFIAVTAMFHNILDFRHYWIFIGLSLISDHWTDVYRKKPEMTSPPRRIELHTVWHSDGEAPGSRGRNRQA